MIESKEDLTFFQAVQIDCVYMYLTGELIKGQGLANYFEYWMSSDLAPLNPEESDFISSLVGTS